MTINHPVPRVRSTIDDVAAAAGVSRGTVSRVMNGKPWVSDEARRAVEAAVKATDYRVNGHARNLRRQHSNMVALVLCESAGRLFADPNFAVIIEGIAAVLEKTGMSLCLLIAGTATERANAIEMIHSNKVDGAFLVSAHDEYGILEQLSTANVPLVVCGIPAGVPDTVSYVSSDEVDGARRATEHLLSLGRSALATITGPADIAGAKLRLFGYQLAIGKSTPITAEGDYTRSSGSLAMARLLDSGNTIDAVFVANDLMAAGALDELNNRGIKVPQEIAIIGFDDSSIAPAVSPSLTTMRQRFDDITREMVRLLLAGIAGESPRHTLIGTELVVRESTAGFPFETFSSHHLRTI